MKRQSLIIAASLLVCPALAAAWTSGSPFSAKVHQHEFARVDAKNEGCKVQAKLSFTAPESAYREPAAVRNYYRFKARIRFASGKNALSPTFFSKKPGNHSFIFEHDTTSEACWGKAEQKIIGVDVEGCRGKGCTVQPFKN